MCENGLFVFRRDLRIIDNTTLNAIAEKCKNIFTVFIFTPEQITDKNTYKSSNAVQFMLESLGSLAADISAAGGQLYTFYGENNKIISYLIKRLKISLIAYNKDITPYAIARDTEIQKLCEESKCECESLPDYYINEPMSVTTSTESQYKKFTPYYNAAAIITPSYPAADKGIKFSKTTMVLKYQMSIVHAATKFTKYNSDINVHGGRPEALKYLKVVKSEQHNYAKTRNILSIHTTNLSAFIKFGCVSIREVYKSFGGFDRDKTTQPAELIKQLIWRDFYANILYNYPSVLGKSMKPRYEKIKWPGLLAHLELWKQGNTGFPVVDAGMRQLNKTGYMHNRCRLIVASFLIKTLLIDWRKGEQYFATKLVDYDPASNNLNWQWCASTAIDSQPYFRIFNPWLQQKNYDKDCIYIKKWMPELNDIPVAHIHKWYEKHAEYNNGGKIYTAPICDYATQKELALKLYK